MLKPQYPYTANWLSLCTQGERDFDYTLFFSSRHHTVDIVALRKVKFIIYIVITFYPSQHISYISNIKSTENILYYPNFSVTVSKHFSDESTLQTLNTTRLFFCLRYSEVTYLYILNVVAGVEL